MPELGKALTDQKRPDNSPASDNIVSMHPDLELHNHLLHASIRHNYLNYKSYHSMIPELPYDYIWYKYQ